MAAVGETQLPPLHHWNSEGPRSNVLKTRFYRWDGDALNSRLVAKGEGFQ